MATTLRLLTALASQTHRQTGAHPEHPVPHATARSKTSLAAVFGPSPQGDWLLRCCHPRQSMRLPTVGQRALEGTCAACWLLLRSAFVDRLVVAINTLFENTR